MREKEQFYLLATFLKTMIFSVPFMELSSPSCTFRQGGAHGSLYLPIKQEMSAVVTNVYLSRGALGILGKW